MQTKIFLQLKSMCLMMITLSVFLSGCSLPLLESGHDAGTPTFQSRYARVTELPDRSDIPYDMLFPKEIPQELRENHEKLGDIMLRDGNLPGAYVQYMKGIKNNPEDTELRYKLATTLYLGGNYREAEKEYLRIIKNDKDFALAYQGLGQAYLNLDQIHDARKSFLKAIEMNPKLWKSLNSLGTIYDLQKDHAKATAAYEDAITIRPDLGELYNNLGVSLLLQKQYRSAAISFEQSLKTGFREKRVYNNLGLAFAGIGANAKALRAFNIGGGGPAAFNNMGCIYMDQGDYLHAIEAFEKAIATSPKFYEKAYENLQLAQRMEKSIVE